MNKKFYTLVAGLLLAGGLFTTADAETFAEVKDKCDGKRYYVLVDDRGNASVEAGSNYLTLKEKPYYTSKENAQLWEVKLVEGGYKLKNTKGEYLKVTVDNGDGGKTVYDTFNGDNIALWFSNGKGFHGNLENADAQGPVNQENSVWRYNLVEANAAMTAAEVNAQLGKDAGFALQIGNVKNNAFAAYDLEGNVFTGDLKASDKAIKDGNKEVYGAPAEGYYLQDADGNYLVLTTATWSTQNIIDNNVKKGLKFTKMSAEELNIQKQRDDRQTDATKKVIKSVTFQISNNEYNSWLEVAALDGTDKLELVVVDFNNEYALTVGTSSTDLAPDYNTTTGKTYVQFGKNNLVDMKKFVVKDSYYTIVRNEDDKVLGATCGKDAAFVEAGQVQLDMPEGMWAISYNGNGNATFTNREANIKASVFEIDPSKFYYVVGEEDVYEYAGKKYTIKAHAISDLAAGYADFGKTTQKSFNIGVYSPVWDGVAYMAENHAGKHQIGLDTKAENATPWRLIANDKASTIDKVTDERSATDSLYVINTLSYYGKKNNEEGWYTTIDTLKVVSYQLKNATNGEFVKYNTTTKYYDCGTTATNFVFKKVGESYNLVEVTLPTGTAKYASFNKKKVYGGDSAEKGLLNQVSCMYERTENDLFKVEEANAALYRRVANPLDTVSIYRDENASQLLFEDKTFLGLANDKQFEFAPAMLADTAYTPADTDRPQYLLVVDPTLYAKGWYCPYNDDHNDPEWQAAHNGHCEDAVPTKGYASGRYLVNLKDSAVAFAADKKNLHAVNPYINTEKYYRLGFVQATHRNDSLIIASNKNRIFVGDENYNVAKFGFKYVNEEAGSFRIETANYKKIGGTDAGKLDADKLGYIKWMNGVVVVVDEEANADIFNMNENENRIPTANEGVNAEAGVSVVAVDGAIIVKNAAGKKVAISNILGKAIANTTIASDYETIAAPAGIAVVAVEGEEAVKVVVK